MFNIHLVELFFLKIHFVLFYISLYCQRCALYIFKEKLQWRLHVIWLITIWNCTNHQTSSVNYNWVESFAVWLKTAYWQSIVLAVSMVLCKKVRLNNTETINIQFHICNIECRQISKSFHTNHVLIYPQISFVYSESTMPFGFSTNTHSSLLPNLYSNIYIFAAYSFIWPLWC